MKRDENKREIFLDDLPKIKEGTNIGKIDWVKSSILKCMVNFIYEDVKGSYKIINYESKGQKLTIEYNNIKYFIATSNFKQCKIGKIIGKTTSEFKVEIGQVFKDNNRDMTIIDREHRIANSGQKCKWYKYTCNKCGWTEGWIKAKGCSCCANRTVVEGINDITTNAPWMIPYFQGGIEEAKLYTKCSSKSLFFKCTDCGRVSTKNRRIADLYQSKVCSCSCGDGYRVPNKIMFNILEQLNIYFEKEYSPNWINLRAYDFYIPSLNIIVEMDGGFHFKDNEMSGQTKERTKEIDDYKDKMAKEQGIEVIRIDCAYNNLANRFDYIKYNILNSKLKELLSLNKINWEKVLEFSLSNILKKVCEYKNNNKNLTTTEIGKIFNLSFSTIIEYLKIGNDIGWCFYSSKEEQLKTLISNSIKNREKFSKKVEVFKNGVSLGVFSSCIELERISEELLGIKLYNGQISCVCNANSKRNRRYYKGFELKYV